MNREMFSDCFLLCYENQGFINNKIPVCVISLIGIISETITLWLAAVKSVGTFLLGYLLKCPQKQSCWPELLPAHPGAGRDAVWIQWLCCLE